MITVLLVLSILPLVPGVLLISSLMLLPTVGVPEIVLVTTPVLPVNTTEPDFLPSAKSADTLVPLSVQYTVVGLGKPVVLMVNDTVCEPITLARLAVMVFTESGKYT
jgi:hypothetical protein